jgi:hypothetical protein
MRRNLNAPSFRAAGIICVVAAGLLLDQKLPFGGQIITNIAVWLIFICILRHASRQEQVSLVACVFYATIGEIFLSLAWGLYEYRLGNIPLFVPPGHALLFMVGTALAPRLSDRLAWSVPLLAAPFVVLLSVTGSDTLGAPLFALLLLCMVFGPAKKLYATMFLLALAMEIYGTWLGNWTWSPHVPWLGLTMLNPPLAAGAFYCVLDLLVTATNAAFERRRATAAAEVANVGNYGIGRQSGFTRRSPRPTGEGAPERGAGTRLRDATVKAHNRTRISGALHPAAGSHPSASRRNPVPPSAGAEVRDRAMSRSYVKLDGQP